MPIAVGVNVEDGLWVPQTQSWLIPPPSNTPTGSTTTTYSSKTISTAKIEGGGGVAGAPKRRPIGAMVGMYDNEVMMALFGGGEF